MRLGTTRRKRSRVDHLDNESMNWKSFTTKQRPTNHGCGRYEHEYLSKKERRTKVNIRDTNLRL